MDCMDEIDGMDGMEGGVSDLDRAWTESVACVLTPGTVLR